MICHSIRSKGEKMISPKSEQETQPVEQQVRRNWKKRGRILRMPISVLAIWAALYIAASAIPALPVPGMGGMITVNAVMTAISGMILGPAAAVANAAGGIVGMLLYPYGFSAGPLGFLTVTLGGLVAGLLFADKWIPAAILEALIIGAWYVNPSARQTGMWMVPLPYSAIAVLVILIPQLRKWVRKSILELHKVNMWPAVFLMVCVGHSAEYLTTNDMVNWMYKLTWQYWVPTLPYWIGVDTVIILVSTAVGVGVLIGLRKARLPQFSDTLDK
jgi:hypothetical protein